MPDRAACDIDGFLSHGFGPLNCDDLAKCLGIAGENPLSARRGQSKKCEEYFVIWARPATCAGIHFPPLPLLRHGAQIVIVRSDVPAIRLPQSRAAIAFASSELAATIRCIIAMNRFCSALLRSATVSRCAARAEASIWRSKAAPALVSRQICARRSR